MPSETSDGRGPEEGQADLTHIDRVGRARMVDVTGKPWTRRRALARCRVDLGETAMGVLAGIIGAKSGPGEITLGEVLESARLAGVQAAKQTPKLVPLCHPLKISNAEVRLSIGSDCVHIEGEAEVFGPTGVEMEALTACTVAALAIVSSLLPVAPEASVNELGLWEKSGGRSGSWRRPSQT